MLSTWEDLQEEAAGKAKARPGQSPNTHSPESAGTELTGQSTDPGKPVWGCSPLRSLQASHMGTGQPAPSMGSQHITLPTPRLRVSSALTHPRAGYCRIYKTPREANVPLGTSADSTSRLSVLKEPLWLLSPRTVGSVMEELSSNFINFNFFKFWGHAVRHVES